MKRFDDALIVTDLDGTLYENQNHMIPQNEQAIEKFMSLGGHFTFATGFPPRVRWHKKSKQAVPRLPTTAIRSMTIKTINFCFRSICRMKSNRSPKKFIKNSPSAALKCIVMNKFMFCSQTMWSKNICIMSRFPASWRILRKWNNYLGRNC